MANQGIRKTNPKFSRINNTVYVKEGNFEQAMKIFKRKTKKSNIRQECKDRMFYTKPSEKRRLAKKRAVRKQYMITKSIKKPA